MKPTTKNLSTIANNTRPDIRSVNLHIIKQCNLKCRFCFATFRDVKGRLDVDAWKRILQRLAEAGTQKVNFAGGEPTIYPQLGELIHEVTRLGMTSSIVTNGFRLRDLLERYGQSLDWVGLSVDSADEQTQKRLGRGNGLHVKQALELSRLARQCNCRLKLNTVVTALNWEEDMSAFVRTFAPERWKVFQVLKIVGQNDGSVEPLLIDEFQFQRFVDRHKAVGVNPVPEDNDSMLESYVMVDPVGRFFSDSGQRHTYSRPILDVGVKAAYGEIIHDPIKTVARGGIYDWAARSATRPPFVVVEGLDGVGKSTVAEDLAAALDAKVMNTPGEKMRELRWPVHHALGSNADATCALYLATVLAEGGRAADLLKSGTPVVMDRYWLSTVAYGAARGASIDFISAAAAVPRPDVTLVLELDEDERQRRLSERGASDEDKLTLDNSFASTVRSRMREGQPQMLGPVKYINVTGLSRATIIDRVLSALRRSRTGPLPLIP